MAKKDILAVAQGEIIGAKCRIITANDPSHVGVEGSIIYETRNTIHIAKDNNELFSDCEIGRVIVVPKNGTVIELSPYGNSKRYKLDLSSIMYRPEDRIKKVKFRKVRQYGKG